MAKHRQWSDEDYAYLVELTKTKTANQIFAGGFFPNVSSLSALEGAIGRAKAKLAPTEPPAATQQRKPFTVQPIPTPNRPIEDIIRDQAERFKEKQARWRVKHEGIEVRLADTGPFGIVFVGDPHADDDGCDLEKLSADLEIIKHTPHVHAINMGDLCNSWVRALGHLYAHQHTTDDEATELMRWLCGYVDWMLIILGNHDKWGPLAAEICKQSGNLYASHGAMLKVICGDTSVIIDARHTHRGNSMYNPSHGQLKQNYRGSQADIIIGAHTHVSAYTMVRNGVSGKLGHAIRVGAYKRCDEYADAGGFSEDYISPSVMAVVDPERDDVGRIHIFHDLDQGAVFLEALRTRHEMQIAA